MSNLINFGQYDRTIYDYLLDTYQSLIYKKCLFKHNKKHVIFSVSQDAWMWLLWIWLLAIIMKFYSLYKFIKTLKPKVH